MKPTLVSEVWKHSKQNYIQVGLKLIVQLTETSKKSDNESKDLRLKGIKDITEDLIKTINEERI